MIKKLVLAAIAASLVLTACSRTVPTYYMTSHLAPPAVASCIERKVDDTRAYVGQVKKYDNGMTQVAMKAPAKQDSAVAAVIYNILPAPNGSKLKVFTGRDWVSPQKIVQETTSGCAKFSPTEFDFDVN